MLKTLNLLWRRYKGRRCRVLRKRRQADWKKALADKQRAIDARLGATRMQFLGEFGFWPSNLREEGPARQCLIKLIAHANCVRTAYTQMMNQELSLEEREVHQRTYTRVYEKYWKAREVLGSYDTGLERVIPDWEALHESIDAIHIPSFLRNVRTLEIQPA